MPRPAPFLYLYMIALTLVSCLLLASGRADANDDFSRWLMELRREAASKGISATTLDEALTGIQPIDRIIELDRKQPEFTQTFWRYLDQRISDQRISRGRALLTEHGPLLAEIEKKYGVQPRFLVAFWGLESNYGDYQGNFPVVGALATLAYDPRRSDFFRQELLAALTILEGRHIKVNDMKGSWAGAMGQVQFMPSTFVRYAVDYNGDQRRDIWQTMPDIFASAANFLSNAGWQRGRTWGMEIRLPQGFDPELTGLDTKKAGTDWQNLGVRQIDGADLPPLSGDTSIMIPSGYTGPAFLVFDNYRTILNWNRSHFYAVAVGHLADRLIDGPAFASPRPAEETPLSRQQIMEIQTGLTDAGFDPGPADGVPGSKTRLAIKNFQRTAQLPADGFPSLELLEKLSATKRVINSQP